MRGILCRRKAVPSDRGWEVVVSPIESSQGWYCSILAAAQPVNHRCREFERLPPWGSVVIVHSNHLHHTGDRTMKHATALTLATALLLGLTTAPEPTAQKPHP